MISKLRGIISKQYVHSKSKLCVMSSGQNLILLTVTRDRYVWHSFHFVLWFHSFQNSRNMCEQELQGNLVPTKYWQDGFAQVSRASIQPPFVDPIHVWLELL